MQKLIAVALFSLFSAFAGATSQDNGHISVPDVFVIDVRGMRYFPQDAKIRTGTTVTWRFLSGPHDVKQSADAADCKGSPNGFASPYLFSGNYSNTFGTPGTYYYICSVANHCVAGMKGTVTVIDGYVPPNASESTQVESPVDALPFPVIPPQPVVPVTNKDIGTSSAIRTHPAFVLAFLACILVAL